MKTRPVTVSAPALGQGSSLPPPRMRWEIMYRRAVCLADLVVIVVAARVGLVFHDGSLQLGSSAWPGALALVSTIVLLAGLVGRRCWEPRILGQGAEEFRRVGAAVRAAIVVLALAGLAVHAPDLGPWVFGVLPATGVALALSRFGLRRVLHARRSRGGCMVPVLVAGSVEEVADLIARTRREAHNGWLIEAVCVPTPPGGSALNDVCGVPVVGDLDEMVTSVRGGGYRIVVVVPDPAWTRRRLRDMAWELEGTPAALIVAPALMEVTGPRLHMTPVYGLTLLRVSKPSFTGVRWLLKDAIERISALAGLAVLTPLLLMIALAIKRDDGGPVLFRQERVGRGGKTFMMLKFRSMGVDAEHQLGALETGNEGAGPLFKLRHDPRVTRVGALMRRYSLDELPQLLNVVRGHMSLVGPRPPLPREVLLYATDAMRRLLVKPGLTGLWQISGRSDLSWEETIRLDLRYVENWSFALDAMILWKTIAAVLRPTGAY
ncbi:MAG: sugar transferase [Pseudonocardiales bacterium]|nr:sugar transferase [Pseudonocardiales bacterium]